MTKSPFYLTTAIYYANAAPHIGHAYEIIAADVIARFHRLLGEDVYFLTGTDEHGIKVEKTAGKHGKTPKDYVDGVSESFKSTWATLNISYSRFIRTSEPAHYAVVQQLWRQLITQGDIYKATYTGLYCAGCEAFVLAKDLTPEGFCPHHLTPPDPVEEENYFFRLSKYRDRLKEFLLHETQDAFGGFIIPESRRQEIFNQIEDLEDISFSRARRSVTWGIPVPDDDEQVIYVWMDALTNYLTGLNFGEDNDLRGRFWPPDVQVIGKDILRFHAIYWPAILMALDIPPPKNLLVHGFINIGESKISKSVGTVISVEDLMARFELTHADPIRYYMMASAGFGQDGNYTDEEFKNRINADLANNLGNLLNRTLSMLNKYFDGKVPESGVGREVLLNPEKLEEIIAAYKLYQFNAAIQHMMDVVDIANKFVHQSEPWTLHKEGRLDALANVLYSVLDFLRQVAVLLSPITPTMSQRIWEQLGLAGNLTELELVLPDAVLRNPLPAGQQTALGDPILPRLDSEIVGAGKKK